MGRKTSIEICSETGRKKYVERQTVWSETGKEKFRERERHIV